MELERLRISMPEYLAEGSRCLKAVGAWLDNAEYRRYAGYKRLEMS